MKGVNMQTETAEITSEVKGKKKKTASQKGSASRDKGNRGQAEAKLILQERDWEILESSCGASSEDFFGVCPNGTIYAIEVKNHVDIKVNQFCQQARTQAAKRKRAKWLLMARIAGYPGTWLVIGSGQHPTVWRACGIPVA
jgi:hypothetical protein